MKAGLALNPLLENAEYNWYCHISYTNKTRLYTFSVIVDGMVKYTITKPSWVECLHAGIEFMWIKMGKKRCIPTNTDNPYISKEDNPPCHAPK